MSREALLKKGICPRCGQSYRWIYQEKIAGRTYLYAVHEEIVEGKKKRRKCYLGPADSYEYVSKTHDLSFYGMTKEDRYITYLEEILNLLGSEESISTDPEEFKRDFENVIRIRSLLKKINNEVEERLEKIIQTMISDIKASAEVLRRDYPDNSQAIEILRMLKVFEEEIERTGLEKSYKIMKEEALRSYIEKYLQLKERLYQFNL